MGAKGIESLPSGYSDGGTVTPTEQLQIKISANTSVAVGAYMDTVYDGTTKRIYLPEKSTGAELLLYPDTLGNTYYDAALINLAASVP